MSFFRSSKGPGASSGPDHGPFSIDDAFDIPEDDEAVAAVSAEEASSLPIIRNGVLRLSAEAERATYKGHASTDEEANGAGGGSSDGASLIQSGEGGGPTGYYEGPPPVTYWWTHPKIRSNLKVVLAACLLVLLGAGTKYKFVFPHQDAPN